MKTIAIPFGLAAALTVGATAVAADTAKEANLVEQGRYIVRIAGCNDCHTVNYPETGGKVAEAEWLTGNPVGFSGPWGTTYPANLRLLFASLSEMEWMERARKPLRPPMPYFNLQAMSDQDLRAVYAFIRSLGAKGQPAPTYVAPDVAVTTPYIEFVPKNLPTSHAMKGK